MSRFKATYNGDVIGWYDTADEAQEAIDAAREQEHREEHAWEQQQREQMGIT